MTVHYVFMMPRAGAVTPFDRSVLLQHGTGLARRIQQLVQPVHA